MNIKLGGISIGRSALYAQQMGNEVAYFCEDAVLGRYISPFPCDEDVCHQACRLKDEYGNDCIWEGDCVDYDFHVEVEHSNQEPPTPPDDDDDESGGSGNQGSGNQSGGNQGSGNHGGGDSGSGNYGQYYTPRANDVLLKNKMKLRWEKQSYKKECVPFTMAYAAELTCNLKGGQNWFKRIFYELSKKNVERDGIVPSFMDEYVGMIFDFNIINSGQQIRNAITNQHPVLATISNGGSPHEVLIVGYNTSISNVTIYICINPGTGTYEDHQYGDFIGGNYHKYEIININSNLNSRRGSVYEEDNDF